MIKYFDNDKYNNKNSKSKYYFNSLTRCGIKINNISLINNFNIIDALSDIIYSQFYYSYISSLKSENKPKFQIIFKKNELNIMKTMTHGCLLVNQSLTQRNKLQWMKKFLSLAGELALLHYNGIVHGDIKDNNIIIINDVLAFIDFDLSGVLSTSTSPAFGGEFGNSFKSDVISFVMVMFAFFNEKEFGNFYSDNMYKILTIGEIVCKFEECIGDDEHEFDIWRIFIRSETAEELYINISKYIGMIANNEIIGNLRRNVHNNFIYYINYVNSDNKKIVEDFKELIDNNQTIYTPEIYKLCKSKKINNEINDVY